MSQNASFTPAPDLINERRVLGTVPYPANVANSSAKKEKAGLP
jgi:hypothetical protein